ncbi:MAG TPA: hypothetical protein VFG78_09580 [Gemmatimonadota bacterium]|nr:hypothetical protein [Gemmatimonadota bacterium]
MAEIQVTAERGDVYHVRVTEADGSSEHHVTATAAHVEAYGAGAGPEALIEESFRFLLEREPKESILGRFELPVIARYFPAYPKEIRRRLAG